MPNNGDEFAEGLLGIAHELYALGETARVTAELAAPRIQTLIDEGLAQGVGPDAKPWEPLKDRSGRVPFSNPRNPRDAMTPRVEPVGPLLRIRVSGWANVHNFTLAWRDAIQEAAKEATALLAPKLAAGGGIEVK
jgi:hypothetical protein